MLLAVWCEKIEEPLLKPSAAFSLVGAVSCRNYFLSASSSCTVIRLVGKWSLHKTVPIVLAPQAEIPYCYLSLNCPLNAEPSLSVSEISGDGR